MINRHYASTEFITGLRAIAIFMVFVIHSGGGGLRNIAQHGDRIVDLGKHGIDIFFVISGFTIFYQLYKKNYILKDFLLVRLARISIPYFPILIGLYFYTLYGGDWSNYWANKFNDGEISIWNLVTHLFYVSYIDVKYANTIIGVEWTLAIEVFYYFLLGYLLTKTNALVSIRRLVWYLIILFGFIVAFTKINTLFFSWLPFKYSYMFLLGGLAFYIREIFSSKYNAVFLKRTSNISIMFSLTVFIWFLIDTNIPYKTTLNDVFFSLITFFLIISVNDQALLSKVFNNRMMIFFGSISFSFYLLHILVLNLPIFHMDIENITFSFFYYLILTIVISTVYYLLMEVKVYKSIKNFILKKSMNV